MGGGGTKIELSGTQSVLSLNYLSPHNINDPSRDHTRLGDGCHLIE